MEVEDIESSLMCSGEPNCLSDLIAKTVNTMCRFNAATATVDASVAVLNDVEEGLKELSELFSDADEETQSEMISEILSFPNNLPTYYKFADKLYKDWDGTGSVSSCFSLILSNLASWTDKSSHLAHEINAQGLLVIHIRHLLKLQLKEDELDSAVVENTALEMLTIIHNCVKDSNLQHFYLGNTINWIQVLSPWVQCSHSSLRMLVRFVLGYLRPRLGEDSLELLNMDDNDWKIFMTMFKDSCQPPDFIATMVGTMTPILQQLSQLVSQVSVSDTPLSQPCENEVKSHLLQDMTCPIQELLVTKNEIVASIDVTENSYTFSASEIMKALENLLSTEANRQTFHSFEFLSHTKELLSHGETKEKIAVCSLLWSLVGHSPVLQAELRDEDSTLIIGLKQLHGNQNHELQLLSRCITISVHGGEDEESQMMYIRSCYQYKRYHDCIENCNKMEHLAEAKIYKAKSLYHVYTQEKVLLAAEQDKLTPRIFHQRHETCYSKAKTVISLLGRFLNKREEFFDHECSQILDLAMMDYIYETNRLRDFQRCFLCRTIKNLDQPSDQPKVKKEQVSSSEIEVQTDELFISTQELTLSSKNVVHHDLLEDREDQNVKTQVGGMDTSNIDESLPKDKLQSMTSSKAKHQQGLQASHLFPKAIIKRFVSAVPLAKGKKVCALKGFRPVFDYSRDSLYSYGEATLYMLCHDCETLLSISESWFLWNFFSKVYDPSNPSAPKDAHSIAYNDHLFKFCVGLIFRLLNYDITAVLNPDDIYCLLEQCRAVLRPESVPWSVELPDVYFLMTPIDEDGDEYGLINQFLTGTMSRLYGFHHLETGLQSLDTVIPSFAHFLVIHMGVLNILVKLQPSADYEIDPGFRILPDGGVYTAPRNADRKRFVPPGVYTSFQVYAMEMERNWLEGPSLTYEPLEDPHEKESDMFGILKAEALDESRVISQKRLTHVSADHPRMLCFLPPGFDITPPINVPKDHTILMHHTHGDKERGLILFLNIGFSTSDGYGLDKPYIIVYNYQPGYIFASCAFISVEEMQPVGFLPKTRGISTVKNQDELLRDYQKKNYASVVRCMLEEKGFHSLKSLIYRLAAKRKLPLVDAQCTPCSSEEVKRCCYCANKCDRCFKSIPKMAISLEGPEEAGLDFKFCSLKCYQTSIEPPHSNCYYLVDSKGNLKDIGNKSNYIVPEVFTPSCGPIASSHKILLHIFCVGTNWAGYLREDEIALCVGAFEHPHEQLYVVHHGRSLTGQLSLEFFVSDDLSPSHPLPYLLAENVAEEVKGLKDDKVIQPHLLHVIGVISSSTGFDIPLTTSSLPNDLASALALIFSPQDDGKKQEKDVTSEPMNEDDDMFVDFEIFNQESNN